MSYFEGALEVVGHIVDGTPIYTFGTAYQLLNRERNSSMDAIDPKPADKPLTHAQKRVQERLRVFQVKASNPKKQSEAWGLWGELRDIVPATLREPLQKNWETVRKGGETVPFSASLNEVRKACGLPEEP